MTPEEQARPASAPRALELDPPATNPRLPEVPPTFTWTREGWGHALRCVPLQAVTDHLFTTRQLALAGAEDETRLASAIGARRAVLLSQVHGNAVVTVRRGAPPPASRSEADVLISDDPSIAIVVRAADCVPLLMADRGRGVVAAVHAGWRGTAARAAVAAVHALVREFGTQPADLTVAIGPSIGPCCYEVGSELVDAFAAAGHERHLIQRWFATPPPRRGAFARRGSAAAEGRLHLDVAGANRDQLVIAGVDEAQIHMAGVCTAMHLDVLTSFRVEKEKAGRIAGAIRARQ